MAKTIYIPENKISLLKEYFTRGEIDGLGENFFVFFRDKFFIFNSNSDVLKNAEELIHLLNDAGLDDYAYNLENFLASNGPKRFSNYAYVSLKDVPRILCGTINGNDLHLSNNIFYDVLNSPEFKKLASSNSFSNIYVGSESGTRDKLVFSNDSSEKTLGDKYIPNTLYHGTILRNAIGIVTKGLRPSPERSNFTDKGIYHADTVFLSKDVTTACAYSSMFSHSFITDINLLPVVIEYDVNKMDESRINLDFDLYTSHGNGKDKPYEKVLRGIDEVDPIRAQRIRLFNRKSGTVDVLKDDPLKFNRVGYRGVVMPNAIKKIYVFTSRDNAQMFIPEWEFASVNDFLNSMDDIKEFCLNNIDLDESKKVLPPYEKDEFEIGDEGGNNEYFHIDENVELELDADEVSLKSFKKNDTLAFKLWDGFKLNPRARLRLLDIADDFWDTTDVSWVKPSGVILTGSICNFNWSKYSDIDLHLVVNFSEVDERKDFVQEYFDAKKNEWNNSHKGLKIYGYPVEVYVEDIDAETESGGIYDLEENKWIKKPSKDEIKPIGLNKYDIKNLVAKYCTKIDNLCDQADATDDKHILGEIGKRANKLLNRIKKMRKFGLERSGEGDPFNIAYKCYRRMGYLDKLFDIKSELYDRIKSISESKVIRESSDDIFEIAKERFGVTYDIRGCGYILPDGSMLDFTGSHQVTGDTSHLKGRRSVDHREISDLNYGVDGKTKTKLNVSMAKFIKMGAIRVHASSTWGTINLYVKPTQQQIDALLRLIRYSKGCVSVEIGDGDESLSYGEYEEAKPRKVVADILRYFDEGINLEVDINESKKTVFISEKRLNGIKSVLKESQESKSISAAKKLVMQKLNYNEQQADEFIRVKLRNDLPVLRTPEGGKFILGATRMFCDGELRTANDIGNLNSTLKLVASEAHINEYDRNLNGLSCRELIQRFAKNMSDNLETEKNEISQMTFDTPSDYEIVRIDSFEQSSEYGDYTSWCVTHQEEMFNSYTSGGIDQFYFCLKNGFEGVKKVSSEGCPLDEYGLSMIAVSVNENGMLNTCTCRWNHDKGGDDNIMDAKQVSQVIGMNFFDVFKPNNKWKGMLDNAKQRLANGESPKSVFDYCDVFDEGFALVELNNKYNFISREGKFLSEQWFDYCGTFRKGFAKVMLNNKWNFINQNGNFVSNQWFDMCGYFREGFGVVELNGKWNFINQEGKLLSEQWFDDCYHFNGDFAKVKLNDKWYKLDRSGRLHNLNESKKTVFISEGQIELIKEYLDKDHNMPLYKYFKWADKANDDEKAESLAWTNAHHLIDYLVNLIEVGKIDNEKDIELITNAPDDYYDEDEYIEQFIEIIKKYKLSSHFISWCYDRINYMENPSWMYMSFIRPVKNEWCIHFGSDSDNIAREGFTGGTYELDYLAYTNAGKDKPYEGYDFAFLIDDRNVDFNNYGNEAVIFQTSGVLCYHYGDEQNQVIFWGPYAKNFIPIKYDEYEGEWVVKGMKDQILMSGKPSEIAEWATANLPQYRKQIMAGKNGYIPKYYDYKQNKLVPYKKYRNDESTHQIKSILNENVSSYIKLLKEEVNARGNASHDIYRKRWNQEREMLKRFLKNNGTIMTSKENGKTYYVYYDTMLSNLIGINYCVCIQYDMLTGELGHQIYVRAIDKFSQRIFSPRNDTRGRDNKTTLDDTGNYSNFS